MSADLLREAAALMRKRAEGASEGPWEPCVLGSEGYDVRGARPATAGAPRRLRVARCGYEKWETDKANATHIASWHPTVALAVADLLDNEASLIASTESHPALHTPLNGARVDLLLGVARAYLGSDQQAGAS